MVKTKSGHVIISTANSAQSTLKQTAPFTEFASGKTIGIYAGKMVLRSTPELVRIVSQGAPVADALKLLRHYKVPTKKYAQYVGDTSAGLTKRKPSARLRPETSDRLVRLARLMAAAEALHEGDAAAARRWMESPQTALGGATPLDYARTEVGAREVEQLIGRLEHGVFS